MSNATVTLILMATVLGDPKPDPEPGVPPTEEAVWLCHAEHPERCGWYVEDPEGILVPHRHKDEDEHED